MVKQNKYLTFDELCKIFFARGDAYSDNGRFIGNSFGQSIKNFRNKNCVVDQNRLSDQAKQIVNDIITAQQDNDPAADTFLKHVDILTGVAGTVTNSFTCAINKSDVEALFDYINEYSHDCIAVGYVLDYLRKFCASCNITCCLWAKLAIAQMATKWNCAQYADYSVIASQYHHSKQHKSIIKPLLNAARQEIKELADNPTYKAKFDAIQICNDIIYRFSSMALPALLISAIHNEFSNIRNTLSKNEPIEIVDGLSSHTDDVISTFLESKFLDNNIQDDFYLFMHKNELIEPALNSEHSEQTIKDAVILTHAPVTTVPVNNVIEEPIELHITETTVTQKPIIESTPGKDPKPVETHIGTDDIEQPTVESTPGKFRKHLKHKLAQILLNNQQLAWNRKKDPEPDETHVDTGAIEQSTVESAPEKVPELDETHVDTGAIEQPTVESAPEKVPELDETHVDTGAIEQSTVESVPEKDSEPVEEPTVAKTANFGRTKTKKTQKRILIDDESITNIGLYTETEPKNSSKVSLSPKKHKEPIVDNSATEKKQSISSKDKLNTKTEPTIDDANLGIGLYSEAKSQGLLKSLFGRRR